MSKLTELVATLLLELPDCPSLVVAAALGRAARDWYRDTHAWQQELPVINLVPGELVYTMEVPAGAMVLAMRSLLTISHRPHPDNWWWFDPPGDVVFGADPKDEVVLTPVAVLSPSATADSVPDHHVDRYIDDWNHGALWYLRLQRGTPWYSPEDAEYHRNLFRAAILNTRNAQFLDFRDGSLRVRQQPFM